jgi:hypothetical protein
LVQAAAAAAVWVEAVGRIMPVDLAVCMALQVAVVPILKVAAQADKV